MVRSYGLDPELWINHVNDLLSIEPRVIQDYTTKGIVIPKQAAKKQGGRNIYGKIELTKILVAKKLVGSGMSLMEVKDVMKCVDREKADIQFYLEDSGVTRWRGGDPSQEEDEKNRNVINTQEEDEKNDEENLNLITTYDPFPPSSVRHRSFGASQRYPKPPSSGDAEWIDYWGSVMHLLLVHEFHKNKPMSQILIPREWLSPKAHPPQEFDRWLVTVTGGWTVDFILKEMNSELTAIRFLDLASLKKRVAEAILSLPAGEAENIKRVK